MRALFIGSTSVLGSAAAARLREHGHEVVIAGRSSELALDLRDEQLPDWAHHERFDAVVNLAGSVLADTPEALRDMVLVNALGAVTAARVAEATGAGQLVHVSTWYVAQPQAYRAHPLYPVTKRHGEELLAVHTADSPLSVAVLRPSHIYDDEGRCRLNQPGLYWLVDQALAGQTPQLRDPALVRDYLHLDDFCRAVLATVQQRLRGTFTVLSPAARSFAELAAAAQAAVADPDAPARPAGTDAPAPDALPGFASAVSVEEGLRRIARSART